MSQALVQLTKIVSRLSTKSEEVVDCLAKSGASGSADLASYQSRRHSATLAALRKALVREPRKIYSVVERNMAEQFNLTTNLPNAAGHNFSARAWVEHRSKIQSFPRTVRSAWAAAGALDALIQNKPEECKARLCLFLAQLEQEALDHGSALLAQEFACEAAPPFSSFAQHQIPDATEMPYTKLLHPTWVEACAHRLEEVDSYTEMRKKLGQRSKPSNPPNVPPSSKSNPKGGGKAGGKKKGKDSKAQDNEPKEDANN